MKRQTKKVVKRFKAETADENKRRQQHIEHAIRSTALQLTFSKEDGPVLVPPLLEMWNETADQIEREFGDFPIRLGIANAFSFKFLHLPKEPSKIFATAMRAMDLLTYLAATKEEPTP